MRRLARLDQHGFTIVEAVLAAALAASLAAIGLPAMKNWVEGSRARQAAGDLASRFRLARQEAAVTGLAVAIVFDRVGDRWWAATCRDGNGNGVRRSELDGADRCTREAVSLDDRFGGVRVALAADLPDVNGDVGNDDPVRFGTGDMATFTPVGTATAGTLYLESPAGRYAVRVAGANARTRVLRWDAGRGEWVGE